MEAILVILFIFLGPYLLGLILGGGQKAAGAAYDTVTKGGTFADNFSQKIQFKIEKLPPNEDFKSDIYGIYIRGNPNINQYGPVSLVFNLVDINQSENDSNGGLILSTLEDFSPPNSRIFEHRAELENMQGLYWPDWARISVLIPDTLIGPFKGRRSLELECRVWKTEYIEHLWKGENLGGLNIFRHEFELNLPNSGYLEIDEDRLKTQISTVKLAVSIAFADGSLDDAEGNTIKDWIIGIVDSTPDARKEKVKGSLNSALEEGFFAAKSNEVNLKDICKEINQFGSKVDKFDLLELCLDVMAADGQADQEELRQISEISNMIGIDYEEVNKLKDQRIIKLDPSSSSSLGIEEKLGIDPSWEKEKIKKHIVAEYAKWNGRLNSLQAGTERDNAQAMLDLLAEAREKYS